MNEKDLKAGGTFEFANENNKAMVFYGKDFHGNDTFKLVFNGKITKNVKSYRIVKKAVEDLKAEYKLK